VGVDRECEWERSKALGDCRLVSRKPQETRGRRIDGSQGELSLSD
jgi:hypothetical protein